MFKRFGSINRFICLVVDSSGRPNAGFVLGNNHWFGLPHECDYVNKPMKISLSPRIHRTSKADLLTAVAPFEVEFRMIYLKHSSPWQMQMKFMTEHILHLGLCLPKSCTNQQIHELAENYFNTKDTLYQLNYNSTQILQVKNLKLRENFWQKKSCIILGLVYLSLLFNKLRCNLIIQRMC